MKGDLYLGIVSALSVHDDQPVDVNRIFSRRGGRGGFNNSRNATNPWSRSAPAKTYKNTPAVDKLCRHCKTVGKDASIYTSHDVEMCFDLYPEKRRGGGVGVRILSIPVHVYENEQFDPEEAEAFFQAYRMNQGLSCPKGSDTPGQQ